MKTLFKLLYKTVVLVILLVIAAPVFYFAWHMGQPLSQPEFKGLSYYQFNEWRRTEYEERVSRYQVMHPEKKANVGVCENGPRYLAPLILISQSFGYAVAGLLSASPKPNYPIPESVTVLSFLPKWWDTFEYLYWFNTVHMQNFGQSLVEYCRIKPDVPTPEEFEAMRHAHD